MNNRTLLLLLLLFVLLDTGYSFLQHLHVPLDGDMAAIILPAEWYQKVLQDPLGLSVLQGERYGAPNRFFIHWPMSAYFHQVPRWLQTFVGPVDSIYLACALAKTAVQLLLMGLLASFIVRGSGQFKWRDWLLAAALVLPMFQTYGYSVQMALLQKSITYFFFYPVPLALLLCFLLPFYLRNGQGLLPWQHPLLLGLAVALPLSGPLVPAVVLLVCPVAVLAQWWVNLRKSSTTPIAHRATKALSEVPRPLLFYFLLISAVSLWSMYIGSFNVDNRAADAPALFDRYPALLKGCWSLLTQKLGLPLLLAGIAANVFFISKNASPEVRQKLFSIGKWLAVFSVAYLLLLPLGGYRIYRPLIVRHDTVLPVTLCLVFFYGLTAFYLLRKMTWKHQQWYAWGIVAVSAIFTAADLPGFHQNDCEKAALETISQSKAEVVKLPNSCTVMSWHEITDPQSSEVNARLLKIWGVTDEVRLYYSE